MKNFVDLAARGIIKSAPIWRAAWAEPQKRFIERQAEERERRQAEKKETYVYRRKYDNGRMD